MEYLPSYRDSLRADIQPSYSDSLIHHGIKGMHWGVRRFQNADGSYTAQGKKRYGNGTKSKTKKSSMSPAMKAVLAEVAVYSVLAGGASYLDAKSDFDGYAKIVNSPSVRLQIAQTNQLADTYADFDKRLQDDDRGVPPHHAKEIRDAVDGNIKTARDSVKSADKVIARMERHKTLLRLSKRQRDSLEKAKQTRQDLADSYEKISVNGGLLKHQLHRSEAKWKVNQQRDSQNGSESRTRRAGRNTSRTKSTDRAEQMKKQGVNVGSSKEESKRIRDLSKRIQQEQAAGRDTTKLVEELQNAKARKKIALEREQMAHGFVCLYGVNRHGSYLMHHGIKGQKWGVRRFQNADGSYTAQGLKRYAVDTAGRAAKTVSTAAKTAKSAVNAKTALAGATAAKIAKGAAITAGIVGTGIAMKELENNAVMSYDIHRAQRLTDEIMANNFKKLSPEKRQVISESIMDYNSAKVRQDRMSTASRRKALVKDTIAAYAQKYDPRRRDGSALETVRTARLRGKYSKADTTMNTQNVSSYKKALKEGAERRVNPEKWARKDAARREKAAKREQQRRIAENRKRAEAFYNQYGYYPVGMEKYGSRKAG